MSMMSVKKALLSLAVVAACLFPLTSTEAAADANKQVGFGHISMPNDIGNDEFVVKALYFTLKKESKRLKNVVVNYDGQSKKADDYIINVDINKYALESSWKEPSASTRSQEVWHQETKWYDDKNKEHTMHTRRYTTTVSDSPGGFYFRAYVGATVYLQNARTGAVVVQHDGHEGNDKEIDAYTDIIKDFYKKVNKAFKAD